MSGLRAKSVRCSLVVAAIITALPFSAHAGSDSPVKSDVTIYLDGPLLHRGGTVFVVPRAVSSDAWKISHDLPNPARSDPRLYARKPLSDGDRRLSVTASGQISVVRFDYPDEGTFNFRFVPAPESGVPPEKQSSVLLSTGNSYDYHPQTGKEMFVPQLQIVAIAGPDADEGKSRALISQVKLGYLEERYQCEKFQNALSCVVQERNE